jgi:hypothetical protein
MDQNTIANIASNAHHAMIECEGIVEQMRTDPVNPDKVWDAYRAASSRISYVATLLEEAGYPSPFPTA